MFLPMVNRKAGIKALIQLITLPSLPTSKIHVAPGIRRRAEIQTSVFVITFPSPLAGEGQVVTV